MNDLAMAALALTILQWNRTHDVPAADSVSVNMPVNFRPTAWSTEVISNFASYLAIVLRVDEVTDLEKATAIVAGITGPLKQSGAAGWVVDLLEGGKVLPAMLKRQLQLLLPWSKIGSSKASVCPTWAASTSPLSGRGRGHH